MAEAWNKKLKKRCDNKYCDQRVKDRRCNTCSRSCAAKIRSSNPEWSRQKVEQLMRGKLRARRLHINELIKELNLDIDDKKIENLISNMYYKIYKRGYQAGYMRAVQSIDR